MLSYELNFLERIKIYDTPGLQHISHGLKALVRAIEDNAVFGETDILRQLVFRSRNDLGPHTLLFHPADKPGKIVRLEGISNKEIRPRRLESVLHAMQVLFKFLKIQQKIRGLKHISFPSI